MISHIANKQVTDSVPSSQLKLLTVTVPQDASHIINGKLRVIFQPGDLPGEPTALRIDGRTYQVDKRIVPFSREGGHLYFQTHVEPFKTEGAHHAEVKLGSEQWLPITLNVLVALHA